MPRGNLCVRAPFSGDRCPRVSVAPAFFFELGALDDGRCPLGAPPGLFPPPRPLARPRRPRGPTQRRGGGGQGGVPARSGARRGGQGRASDAEPAANPLGRAARAATRPEAARPQRRCVASVRGAKSLGRPSVVGGALPHGGASQPKDRRRPARPTRVRKLHPPPLKVRHSAEKAAALASLSLGHFNPPPQCRHGQTHTRYLKAVAAFVRRWRLAAGRGEAGLGAPRRILGLPSPAEAPQSYGPRGCGQSFQARRKALGGLGPCAPPAWGFFGARQAPRRAGGGAGARPPPPQEPVAPPGAGQGGKRRGTKCQRGQRGPIERRGRRRPTANQCAQRRRGRRRGRGGGSSA